MAIHLPKLFAAVLLFQFHIIPSFAQFWQYATCSFNASDAPYQGNLNSLLTSIGTKAQNNADYFNDTIGTEPNQAYGLIMCYADSNWTSCNNCLSSATALQIVQRCPISKNACFWSVHPNSCLIRYSNESFFSVADSEILWAAHNKNNSYEEPRLLYNARKKLLNRLISEAIASERFLAAGVENVKASSNVYGLLQCTRDLNHLECNQCLNNFVEYMYNAEPNNTVIGARLHGLSCFLRYEIYAFMPTDSSSQPALHSTPRTPLLAILAASASIITALLLASCGIWLWKRNRINKTNSIDNPSADDPSESKIELSASDIKLFDFNTLSSATDNFSKMLGKGAFGCVYEGSLITGDKIAVKRLSATSWQGLDEMRNEVSLLAKLKHKNLVRIVGCCIDENEKIICYEFLPNRSLDNILFAKKPTVRREKFNWETRYKIIKGIAYGLQYLHAESSITIIHRDLKAGNILLDTDMTAKISDFGMARLFDEDVSRKLTSNRAGTLGYMAPEYLNDGKYSAMSDVYSFGVLLLEIVTGQSKRSLNITSETIFNFAQRRAEIYKLIDPAIEDPCLEELSKCIEIILHCVQGDWKKRPKMSEVRAMLDAHSMAIPTMPRQQTTDVPESEQPLINLKKTRSHK